MAAAAGTRPRPSVAILGGDKLRLMIDLDALCSIYQDFNRYLDFCFRRGLRLFKSTEFFDNNTAVHAAVVLFWTKEPVLRITLENLQEKFSTDTPKLLMYFGVPQTDICSQGFLNEIELAKNEFAPLCRNIYTIVRIGSDLQIMTLLRTIMQSIENAEFSNYPSQYTCVSGILDSLKNLDIGATCINNLQTPLRIDGYPMDQCVLRNRPDLRSAVQRFQAPMQRQLVFDASSNPFGRDQKIYENRLDGRILIISNEKFEGGRMEKRELRMSARIDVDNLLFLFKDVLKYERVEVMQNLSANEILNVVAEFSDARDHGSFAILVILSHGSSSHLLGSDFRQVQLRPLIETFANARGLAKKPKLFLIDACRAMPDAGSMSSASAANLEIYDTTVVDDMAQDFGRWYLDTSHPVVQENSPDRSGFILARSTSFGQLSSRVPLRGSRFISSLCWVYCKMAHKYDVVSMISYVNYLMTHLGDDNQRQDGALFKMPPSPQIPSWTIQTAKLFYLKATENGPTVPSNTDETPPADQILLRDLDLESRSRITSPADPSLEVAEDL